MSMMMGMKKEKFGIGEREIKFRAWDGEEMIPKAEEERDKEIIDNILKQ